MTRLIVALGVLVALVGCPSEAPPAPKKPLGHVRFVPAPPTEMDAVPALVVERQKASQAEGRQLLVYVGAHWCEPCQRFQAAAKSGALDADFGDLDFLVFDADVDGERLLLADYESQYIPLMVVPGPDGRGSSRRLEGSVKGDAVADLTPRLKAVLGR